MMDAEQAPQGVDPATPSPARLYDYFLGGSMNFPADRAAGDRLREALPDLYDAAWANRGFHQRSARWMASEHGIGQYIDLGCGLPTKSTTYQAVQPAVPDARVAYVDNDPMVRAMSGRLLADDAHTRLLTADMREPGDVLGHPDLRSLIDFGQPAGLLMTAVVHFVADGSDPWGLVKQYVDALAPGSYLALSHATADKLPPRSVRALSDTYKQATTEIYLRSSAEVMRFFEGLELVPPYRDAEPQITYVGVWDADDPEVADSEGSRVLYCGVARRP